eukprot:TRINITY_DN5748_c1_g1_i1.p1 TRINITY_DN5748_c1_g1~~TRINITY_DN5748_c1_g1_i1.p1  ORF type:complete len:673 (+),score=164.12 TRINITY_DN5748_c1_g1_i1:79-2019(+)
MSTTPGSRESTINLGISAEKIAPRPSPSRHTMPASPSPIAASAAKEGSGSGGGVERPAAKTSTGSSNIKPVSLSQTVIDKAKWKAEATQAHPELLNLLERIRPLPRAVSFGKVYTDRKPPVKDEFLVGPTAITQLILQHLQYEGLKSSQKQLEDESGVKLVDTQQIGQLGESRLLTLLRVAVQDTERVWQLTMAPALSQPDAPQSLVDHLNDLRLLHDESRDESADVNIWDEQEKGNIIFADEVAETEGTRLTGDEKTKAIKAASLNMLVKLLTPENRHDIDFLKTFLLTYQSFTTPAKLLQKLIQRYTMPPELGEGNINIQLRVFNVLKVWVTYHWSDFNEELIQSLKHFIDTLSLRTDNNHILFVKTITSTISNKLKTDEDESKKRKKDFDEIPPEPKVPKAIFSPTLKWDDIDDEEIARQLTILDFEMYSSIKASELLNQSWNKPKLKHRSPNVLRTIARFNDMSEWVASSILAVERVRDRARIMAKFIRIAEYLMKPLNNFNTAMAILAGLNASSVHRLKWTREEMPRQVHQVYESLQAALSSNQAYREYRNLLSHANPPCIPYLGVYLTDLTFVEDGNPDDIHGLINFTKRKYVYLSIDKVKQYQDTAYNLQPVYQIACMFLFHPSHSYSITNFQKITKYF